jgi:acetate---CoA ligase (ADP-forming) subunit beta
MTAISMPAPNEVGGGTTLTEIESKLLFESGGLPVVKTRLAVTCGEAICCAEAIGYPIAMKVVSKEITHKSDAGGVKLDLGNRDEVERAYEEILQSARRFHPNAKILGVSVQKMARTGREVIIGMSKDPELGPLLMFGLGGVMVELMKDVSFRLIPLAPRDVGEMIREIRGYPLLKGFRGSEAVDIPFLEKLLLKVAALVQGHPEIKELDLNPVVAYSDGALVVDARVVLEESAG